MGEDLVYAELPPDEGLEIYEELVTEMGQPVEKPAQTNGPPPVPSSNRPLPQAPSLPERNQVTPQRAPPIAGKGNKSTFFDQQPSPTKRPAAALPPVPTQPVHAGGEELRVSQAFQIFIQSKKTGTSKSRYSTPWAKRTDTSGQEMEFISLQGSDSNIPFVPPNILVKMPEATEVATGNYLRLFIPPASSSQQPPQRSTAGIEMENSTAAGEDGQELVYDDTINANTEETYDDVLQKPDVIPKTADDFNQDTHNDVNIKPSEETYDDVTVRQEDTYDDVIQKPNK
ncbi:hypothetical protein LOD99_6562 [Oopsacas minuta]|uniref:Uncharacterized protein n=1 Tax=Oopsacas minuta TaxID=111878 RepID=A0AAV7JLV2_9METZ|nr:hypothetical protein LOD99_6562 [Oopsacas minuta]